MVAFCLVIAATWGAPTRSVSAALDEPTAPKPITAQQNETCNAIVTQVLEALGEACDKVQRNGACYGNDEVTAEPVTQTVPLKFDAVGDKAPVQIIKNLSTSPMNVEDGTWGVSLLKLQADLPDTMPGQNVTFVVYGETSIKNTTGDMKAFYLTSGLGIPECKAIPSDGVIVRSPKGFRVTFTVNGVQISIASTIRLRATAFKAMEIDLVEGHAWVTTLAGAQTLESGQSVSVILGGLTGMDAVSAPSAPYPTPPDPTLLAMVNSLEQLEVFAGTDLALVPGDPSEVIDDGVDGKDEQGKAKQNKGKAIGKGKVPPGKGNENSGKK